MTAPDLLATPWRETGVPVPEPLPVDGPPPLARVDVTPRPDVPTPREDRVPVR